MLYLHAAPSADRSRMCAWPRAKGQRRRSQQCIRCYAADGNDAAPDMDDGGKSAEFPADAGGDDDGVLGLSGQVGGKGSVPCPSSGSGSVIASSQALSRRGKQNNGWDAIHRASWSRGCRAGPGCLRAQTSVRRAQRARRWVRTGFRGGSRTRGRGCSRAKALPKAKTTACETATGDLL